MLANERLKYISERLEREGSIQLKDICEKLNASESTIRRDLEELEKQNILKRVYGGAVKIASQLNDFTDIAMDNRMSMNRDEKKKIAQKCAEIIKNGDSVFIDGGTTFMDIIEYLEGKKVTVVTHNDYIRAIGDTTVTVIVIGGQNLPNYKMNVGPLTLKFMDSFHFDKAFIGCAGVNCDDLSVYTGEVDTAQVKEVAISKSIQTYLAFDSSKIGVTGFYKFANVGNFNGVIIPENCNLENANNSIFVY